MAEEKITIGKSELRKDAWDKVSGAAAYVADIQLEECSHGILVRSPHHYARIKHVNTKPAQSFPGVRRVLTSADIPGAKKFGALIPDQPSLAFDVVRHLGEPVVLVIADTKKAALAAAELVQIEFETLDPIFDPVEALASGAQKLHPDGNLAAQFDLKEGDPDAEFAEADIVIDEYFDLPRISPAYMEPENSLARWNNDGTITVWVSSQQPFTDQQMIADALDLPIEKVQVKSAVIGGAFGGKEDPSLAILAAFGAWAIKGTLKLVNNRHESFLAHPKRHPAQIWMKVGAKQDGKLVALKAIAHMDTGAYASYGPAVGVILTETLTGSYRIPNVHLETLVVYTNSPYSGAMRGFGSPQSHFVVESMLDILAASLNMSPVTIREKNILRPGDQFFTKVIVNETAKRQEWEWRWPRNQWV